MKDEARGGAGGARGSEGGGGGGGVLGLVTTAVQQGVTVSDTIVCSRISALLYTRFFRALFVRSRPSAFSPRRSFRDRRFSGSNRAMRIPPTAVEVVDVEEDTQSSSSPCSMVLVRCTQ